MPAPSPQQTKLGRLLQLLLTREGGEESKVLLCPLQTPQSNPRPKLAWASPFLHAPSLPWHRWVPSGHLLPPQLTANPFSSAHFSFLPQKNTNPHLPDFNFYSALRSAMTLPSGAKCSEDILSSCCPSRGPVSLRLPYSLS